MGRCSGITIGDCAAVQACVSGLITVTPPGAQMRQIVAQTLVPGTETPITFTSEAYDDAGGHSTTVNTSRYTAVLAGRYWIAGAVTFASDATGNRLVWWRKNGLVLDASRVAFGAANGLQTAVPARTMTVELAVNDYLELAGFHTASGNIDTYVAIAEAQSGMTVQWIRA